MNFRQWLKGSEADNLQQQLQGKIDRFGPAGCKTQDSDGMGHWRYGNWCGPGPELSPDGTRLANGDPLPEPCNAVDAACKQHDLAYHHCKADWRTHGLGSRGTVCTRKADDEFTDALDKLIKAKDAIGRTGVVARMFNKYYKTHRLTQRVMDYYAQKPLPEI